VILTRDNDFSDMAIFFGPPTKVLHLGIRNCRWQKMAAPIVENHAELLLELERPDLAVVEFS
jgi:predicted nuclease of predicted toxin-antitoxin system